MYPDEKDEVEIGRHAKGVEHLINIINVAKIAKKVTLHITNSKVLPNVKKSLASLPKGPTKVELHLHSGDAVTKIRLGGGVELGATTATDMAALGIKMEIE